MKLKFTLIFATLGLLALSGCAGIITPLPETYYAELRLGDDGKRQLLIESDQWMGILNPIGHPGNQHYTQCRFYLQGDEAVYEINQEVALKTNDVGTIAIDRERKSVTLDLELVPGPGSMLEQKKPDPRNGTYHLALVNHDPFYSNDNLK